MSKKKYRSSKKTQRKKIYFRQILSFFRGEGGIFVIFILASVMAGAFVMTGGLMPMLNQAPSANDQVLIDEDSAKQSEEKSLQLVDIKIKPTDTPVPLSSPTPSPTLPPPVCSDKTAVAIVIDVSGSMDTRDPGSTASRINRLKEALKDFITFFKPDSTLSLIKFSGSGEVVVPMGKVSQNEATLLSIIDRLSADGATNMKDGLEKAASELQSAKRVYPDYKQFTVFMTDGVPESGDCKYRNYSGRYRYYENDNTTICTLEGTNIEPTFFTHKWSPIEPANAIKASGAQIFSINMFQPSTDREETNKNNKAEDLMRAVASDPDSIYYVSSPTTRNLTSTYREIARKICPSS